MKGVEIKERFVELRAKGRSFASIAKELSVSKTTLISWSQEMREEIGNLRQIELESLRETYRIGAERRVAMFAKQLDALDTEIAKRDLSSVPTERLFDMLSKVSREVSTLDTPVTFHRRIRGLQNDTELFTHVIQWQS